MNQVDFLKKVRWLIAKGWCQRAPARDHDHRPVAPVDPSAHSWCITGALAHVYLESDDIITYSKVINNIYRMLSISRGRLVFWNDAPERTQEQVLHMIDETIDRVQFEEDRIITT